MTSTASNTDFTTLTIWTLLPGRYPRHLLPLRLLLLAYLTVQLALSAGTAAAADRTEGARTPPVAVAYISSAAAAAAASSSSAAARD